MGEEENKLGMIKMILKHTMMSPWYFLDIIRVLILRYQTSSLCLSFFLYVCVQDCMPVQVPMYICVKLKKNIVNIFQKLYYKIPIQKNSLNALGNFNLA